FVFRQNQVFCDEEPDTNVVGNANCVTKKQGTRRPGRRYAVAGGAVFENRSSATAPSPTVHDRYSARRPRNTSVPVSGNSSQSASPSSRAIRTGETSSTMPVAVVRYGFAAFQSNRWFTSRPML